MTPHGWALQDKRGELITESWSWTRTECIQRGLKHLYGFVFRGDEIDKTWGALRKRGFRCVKAHVQVTKWEGEK